MRRIQQLLIREPLILFVVLGCALYAATYAVRPTVLAEEIDVPSETIRSLVKGQEDLVACRLRPDEVREVVERYVDDEVLIREAHRQGFDQSDSNVRKRLLNVMRTTLDEPVPVPSVAQLQAYYRDNADRFRTPVSVTLEQVVFSWGSEKIPQDSAAFLEELTDNVDPLSLGDAALIAPRLDREDRLRLLQLFGVDFAEAVLGLPLNIWRGPIESKLGVHYVRIIERYPAELPLFEKVEEYLTQQWQFDERLAIQKKKIDKLREQYRIVLPEEYATMKE